MDSIGVYVARPARDEAIIGKRVDPRIEEIVDVGAAEDGGRAKDIGRSGHGWQRAIVKNSALVVVGIVAVLSAGEQGDIRDPDCVF